MLSTDCMWDYFHQKERNQKVPKLLTYKVTYNVIWNVSCTYRVRGGIAVTYLMFSQSFATELFCNNKRIVPCTHMHILYRKSLYFFLFYFFAFYTCNEKSVTQIILTLSQKDLMSFKTNACVSFHSAGRKV